ncbi:MAG: ABC transporter transmembrane domain-containing protein, partial [Candidatus Ornithospirochaeta sp.]
MSKRSTLSVMGRLSKLVGPLIPYMALAILLGVLGNLAATFVTVLCTASLLSVFGKVGISSVILLVIALVCALLRAFLRYGEQMCNHYCAFRILAIIRDKVFRALRRLAPSKLEGKDRGNLISVITSDIELLEVFYAHTISPIAIATLFSLIMTAFIAAQNLILGIVALLSYAAVGILLPVVTSIKGGDSADRYRKENGEMSSFILESLRGLGEILQYGNGKKRLSEMEKRADNMADAERRIKSNGGFNAAITNAFVLFLDFIMLFVSAILVSKGTLTPSAALLSVVALMSSFGPVIALSSLGNTLQNTVAAGNRVIDILDEE